MTCTLTLHDDENKSKYFITQLCCRKQMPAQRILLEYQQNVKEERV